MGDALCVLAVALYVLNRWMIKPALASGFMHGYFNDLLLIPAALPCVLWVHRLIGLRRHDRAPCFREIALHTLTWSVICEAAGPLVFHRGTADWCDLCACVVGAILGWTWWQRGEAAPRVDRALESGGVKIARAGALENPARICSQNIRATSACLTFNERLAGLSWEHRKSRVCAGEAPVVGRILHGDGVPDFHAVGLRAAAGGLRHRLLWRAEKPGDRGRL
ncbi:MAG: hypothetical protein ACREIA_10305 [Opitutaceae bacterium]